MMVLLTGNPYVGKTSLINLLKTDGFMVFNVDQFIHEIYQVNQIGYILIQTHFGKEYTTNLQVDKKKLKSLVLNDEYAMYKLKILIWPLIKSKLHFLKNHYDFILVEMAIYKLDPLYFHNLFDYIIEIKRESNNTNIDPILTLYQTPHLCYRADYIIDNNQDLLLSYDELKKILNELKNVE